MERRRKAQRRKGGRGRGGGGHNQNGRGQQAGTKNDAHKRGRSKQLKAPRLTAIALGWNSAESNKRRWSARNTPSFVRQVPSSVEIDGSCVGFACIEAAAHSSPDDLAQSCVQGGRSRAVAKSFATGWRMPPFWVSPQKSTIFAAGAANLAFATSMLLVLRRWQVCATLKLRDLQCRVRS